MARCCLYQRGGRGFTMTELLMTAAIIGILAALSIPGIQAVKRRAWEGQAVAKLGNLALQEKRYFADHKTFGKFEDLQDQGLIPKGYTRVGAFHPLMSRSSVRPYIELYSLVFTVPASPHSLFFKIDALPARQGLGLRTFNISVLLDQASVKDTTFTDPPVRDGLTIQGAPVGGY